MKRKNVHKMKHKVEGKNILYLNDDRWLIRESCKTNKEAKAKFKELKDLNKLKD